MKILIVGLKRNEQLKRLVEEGAKRGHEIVGCLASELVVSASNDGFDAKVLGSVDLKSFELIYLWATGKRRWEWATVALWLNSKYKTKIVNEKLIDKEYNYFLSPAIDYLKQVDQKLPFPKSAVAFSAKAIDGIVKEFNFPLIVKPSSGRQGKGVFLVENLVDLYKAVDVLNEESSPAYVVREFVPNDGDIRVFTIGYKAVGAMKRTPKEGDFRSNISQGGTGSIFDLKKNPEVKKIAEKLSKITKTQIAGVDIIINKKTKKPYILEINPGPQFTGFEKYAKTNIALEIIKYFEKLQNK